MDGSAGTTIVEDTGEIRVNSETIVMVVYFFLRDQFLGFSGSSEPSHVICAVMVSFCSKERRAI